jgi:hypothetical protein
MTFRFAKPSVRRVLWSVVAVAAVSCVIAGIALSIGFIVDYDGPQPVPKGEYVRLVIACLTLWGPIFLLTAWPISTPAILVLGFLVACVRRTPVTDKGSERSVAEERNGPG